MGHSRLVPRASQKGNLVGAAVVVAGLRQRQRPLQGAGALAVDLGPRRDVPQGEGPREEGDEGAFAVVKVGLQVPSPVHIDEDLVGRADHLKVPPGRALRLDPIIAASSDHEDWCFSDAEVRDVRILLLVIHRVRMIGNDRLQVHQCGPHVWRHLRRKGGAVQEGRVVPQGSEHQNGTSTCAVPRCGVRLSPINRRNIRVPLQESKGLERLQKRGLAIAALGVEPT
mmetsp:Transcript_100342/g.288243  ORF Transcript_100342/g.288243 Transcript_100342/m.288243 type:complete len:226 (+) Transcript_100342:337-1014(+)